MLAVVVALDVGIVGQRPVQIGLDRRIRVAGHPAEEAEPLPLPGRSGRRRPMPPQISTRAPRSRSRVASAPCPVPLVPMIWEERISFPSHLVDLEGLGCGQSAEKSVRCHRLPQFSWDTIPFFVRWRQQALPQPGPRRNRSGCFLPGSPAAAPPQWPGRSSAAPGRRYR